MAREFRIKPEGRQHGASVVVADGPADLQAWLDAKQAAGAYVASGWGRTTDAMREHFANGAPDLVPRVDAMLDRIEAASPVADIKRETLATVSGGSVNVAAYLAGSPMAMRRRVRVEQPAPLKIVVDVCTSAALSNAIIERRGIAALALLRLLVAAGHAVELYVAHANGNSASSGENGFALMRLDTAPLDLARAAWIMASEGFGRHIGYSASNTAARAGLRVWPWGNTRWNGHLDVQTETYAQCLGVDPSELILLPAMFSGFPRDILQSDEQAAKWVSARYAETLARTAHGEGF